MFAKMWTNGNSYILLGEHHLVYLLGKSRWEFLRTLRLDLAYDSPILLQVLT